jgi:hypothetical protein
MIKSGASDVETSQIVASSETKSGFSSYKTLKKVVGEVLDFPHFNGRTKLHFETSHFSDQSA